MNRPVIVTAVFKAHPNEHDNLVAALQSAIPPVHDENGCELYAIHDAPDGSIVMIEKWTSEELLDRHGEGAAVASLNAAIKPYLSEPVVVTRLTPIHAGDAQRGAI
jgi:quinol monooxygenase YgiN